MLKSIAVTARRDDVREAALALFAERGYHGTSMKDSAARLGIRAPSLYNHVESKQQILLYVVQTPGERVEMLIDRNDLLKHYFDGRWVTLTVARLREHGSDRLHQLQRRVRIRPPRVSPGSADVRRDGTLALLIAVMPDERADAVIAGLRELFEDRSGVMFVTDPYVSRPDSFR